MVLRLDDFAAWRINWADKAANLVEIVKELNLGLDAVVFIDDNPAERARVREALPGVLVPEWPSDMRLYPAALRTLDCFDKASISDEDQQRFRMYLTERQRVELKHQIGSTEEWLRTLSLVVTVEQLNAANISRVVQLLNKTNQFNLSTRRLTSSVLLAWSSVTGRQLWAFRVTDRFGDSGLTGIASAVRDGQRARLEDFVLSGVRCCSSPTTPTSSRRRSGSGVDGSITASDPDLIWPDLATVLRSTSLRRTSGHKHVICMFANQLNMCSG